MYEQRSKSAFAEYYEKLAAYKLEHKDDILELIDGPEPKQKKRVKRDKNAPKAVRSALDLFTQYYRGEYREKRLVDAPMIKASELADELKALWHNQDAELKEVLLCRVFFFGQRF